MSALPIDSVLPDILAALSGANRLVLSAPPGAGKTTRVPLSAMAQDWAAGKQVLLLEPRRIAARMAAERMATLLGETVGGVIGLTTRVDRKVSSRTRLEVITDGLFSRRILSDPALSGVAAVFFDEFHERSINLDLGLALAAEAQTALRPDLRLIAMSATLDSGRIAEKLGAVRIESAGRSYPVETVYLGRSDDRIEVAAARAVRRALHEQSGSILVFLPGAGEIRRTAELLSNLEGGVAVFPLYGALLPREQDLAVSPPRAGERKIVLATDIAESSLTIEGVNVVIDSGLARIAEYDPQQGGGVLATRRASRANIDQRRGRAGRLQPGVCYRLWDEEGTRGLPAEPTPEILNANLSALVLSLAEWGERDYSRLAFIDAPPAARVEAARAELRGAGALDESGSLTERGRRMQDIPVEPRLAAMIAAAATKGDAMLAAEIAILSSERGLGGNSADLRDRIEGFRRDRSPRAASLRAQAARWSRTKDDAASVEHAGRVIAAAMPGAIARQKGAGEFQLASGRGARIDGDQSLAAAPWIAIVDLTGSAARARITAAAPLSEEDALRLGGLVVEERADFDPETGKFRARAVRRLGAIILSTTPLPAPSGAAARQGVIEALEKYGLAVIGASPAIDEFRARLALMRTTRADEFPKLADADLIARSDEWLLPLLGPSLDFSQPTRGDLRRALSALLDWNAARALDEHAPLEIKTPAGNGCAIDYLNPAGPTIEARVQEFFGVSRHPTILCGALPLVVSLLSPARRQVALTKDLPAFWNNGYRDMVKDMRAQYPKHDWPDDPQSARAHGGMTKARLKDRG